MALISLRQLLDHAAEFGYGVPAAARRSLSSSPADFDPRRFLKAATAAAREICKTRYEAFGCSGQAARIRPLPLEAMVERYGRPVRSWFPTGAAHAAAPL